MKKIFLAIEVLYKGRALASAGKWKSGAIKANLIAFLVALGSLGAAYGLDVSITSEVAATIAGGVLALVNVFLFTGTDEELGLQDKTSDILPEDWPGA
jgi:hypothetical protein